MEILNVVSTSSVSHYTSVSPDKPTSTYVNVTSSPNSIAVPPTVATGSVVTVWNTPVSQPVSSRDDGFDEKSVDEFDAVEVANSVYELADESHSMRDIAYDSHVPESKFKSGSVTVITISLPNT